VRVESGRTHFQVCSYGTPGLVIPTLGIAAYSAHRIHSYTMQKTRRGSVSAFSTHEIFFSTSDAAEYHKSCKNDLDRESTAFLTLQLHDCRYKHSTSHTLTTLYIYTPPYPPSSDLPMAGVNHFAPNSLASEFHASDKVALSPPLVKQGEVAMEQEVKLAELTSPLPVWSSTTTLRLRWITKRIYIYTMSSDQLSGSSHKMNARYAIHSVLNDVPFIVILVTRGLTRKHGLTYRWKSRSRLELSALFRSRVCSEDCGFSRYSH